MKARSPPRYLDITRYCEERALFRGQRPRFYLKREPFPSALPSNGRASPGNGAGSGDSAVSGGGGTKGPGGGQVDISGRTVVISA
ncbi:hypothetical protein NDU88_006068 [Pleurodeles waltl]|uniref:Uncharacterized protein n=1 Tax=Pleurodeles waltl TaxID=8319 RepID=A0AAV7L4V8_PLEWA|nr:hypothetical protein NDU88_006068 [Pleurodeles waltl]